MQQVHEKAIENLIRNGYDFDISHSIDRGFKIFLSKIGQFIGFTALYILITGSVILLPMPLFATKKLNLKCFLTGLNCFFLCFLFNWFRVFSLC